MKMPAIILYIILAAVTLTSANAAVHNQLGLILYSFSPETIPAATLQKNMHIDIQPLSNEPVNAPPTYFDNCGVLIQASEYQARW